MFVSFQETINPSTPALCLFVTYQETGWLRLPPSFYLPSLSLPLLYLLPLPFLHPFPRPPISSPPLPSCLLSFPSSSREPHRVDIFVYRFLTYIPISTKCLEHGRSSINVGCMCAHERAYVDTGQPPLYNGPGKEALSKVVL